jgi:hypothetical protein
MTEGDKQVLRHPPSFFLHPKIMVGIMGSTNDYKRGLA